MSTGDLKNNVRKLLVELRQAKYGSNIDIEGLARGRSEAILPLIHYAFLSFSLPLARYISSKGYELFGKNDLRFTQSFYKILLTEFDYRPRLTVQQFLSEGFAERKLMTVSDIFKLCTQKHEQMQKRERKPLRAFNQRGAVSKDTKLTEVKVVRNLETGSHLEEDAPLPLQPPRPTEQSFPTVPELRNSISMESPEEFTPPSQSKIVPLMTSGGVFPFAESKTDDKECNPPPMIASKYRIPSTLTRPTLLSDDPAPIETAQMYWASDNESEHEEEEEEEEEEEDKNDLSLSLSFHVNSRPTEPETRASTTTDSTSVLSVLTHIQNQLEKLQKSITTLEARLTIVETKVQLLEQR